MSDRANGVDPQALLEAAQKLIAAAQTANSSDRLPVVRPRGVVVHARPKNEGEVRESVDRRARIEAGRRARRLPYRAGLATLGAGYAAWGVSELAASAGGSLGTLVATAGTAGACATALSIMRLTYRNRIAEEWRRRWLVAGTGAASWVTTAAAVGPNSWAMTACLALGAAAASAHWLREHAVPRPGDELAEEVIEAELVEPGPSRLGNTDPTDLGDVLALKFADHVAARVLPGAMLTDRIDLTTDEGELLAIRWTIRTPPGSTSFDAIYAQRGRIAAGLNQPAARVLVEPADEDEGWAVLTVTVRDLLAKGIPYEGPRYDNGCIPIGQYADGSGWTEYVACDGVGCRNGLATGEPGSGKSAFLEAVAMGLKSSGVWHVLFGDGDPEGGSSPLLNEIADWAEAGPEGVLRQLEALEALLEVRGMLKATLTADPETGEPVPITDPTRQRPVRELRPCRAFPGVQWILDELHRLSSDPWLRERNFIPRLERLTRIGRKYGIVVLVGTQSLLVGDFGNSAPLRGYLAARNLFAFRNQNKSEKAVVSGLAISPSTLPPGGGYVYAAGTGRLAMARVAWAPDMALFAVDLPDTPLDPYGARAVAPFLPEAPRDPAAVLAEQRRRLQQWLAGQDSSRSGSSRGNPSDAPLRPAASLFGSLDNLSIPAALTAANVIPMQQHTAPAERERLDDGPDLAALKPRHREIYDAMVVGGHRTTGDIAKATGIPLSAVSKGLYALAEVNLSRQLSHGRWEPIGSLQKQTG